jgi:small subunit ribosomal protein S13
MVRIAGVDLPSEKRADIALTYLYGIGRSNVTRLLEKAKIDPAKRLNSFSDDDVSRIAKALEKDFTVEGDLRQQVSGNIKRLREIGSYRGLRHAHNLPSRGQRTRSNARTRRGKRMTIGALKKDDRIKMDQKTVPTSGAGTEAK